MDLVADSFVSTYNRFKYVDFAYSNSVTETKIISRSAHHISGDFMSEVFTDTSYITLAITISILYFLEAQSAIEIEKSGKITLGTI